MECLETQHDSGRELSQKASSTAQPLAATSLLWYHGAVSPHLHAHRCLLHLLLQ